MELKDANTIYNLVCEILLIIKFKQKVQYMQALQLKKFKFEFLGKSISLYKGKATNF